MRTPVMMRTVAVAIALVLPSAAPAFDWGGRLGLDYSREDRWLTGGGHTTLPRLELNLGLDAAGFLYSPAAAQWLASVEWRRLTESNGAIDTTRASLIYRLRSVLFQDPRSPVTLQLQATRIDEDIKVDGTAGSTRADTSTYGADLRLAPPGRPYLNLGYQYLDRQETGPLLRGADRSVHSLSASTGHGAGTYSYAARYAGRFSSGTFDADNYDDHRVDVDVQAVLAQDVTARINEIYFRRIPDNRAPSNQSQELNSLSTVVTGKSDARGQQQVGYVYVHALSSAPGTQDQERAEQRLTYGMHHLFKDSPWQLRALADLSLSEIRSGTVVDRATGQLVSAQAAWRRQDGQDLLELRGGPKLGAREPQSGPVELGYGATAGGTAQHRWTELVGTASYDLTFESDLYAASGWNLRQEALASLTSPFGPGRASAQLQASALRRDGGLLGAGASRSLTALAGYQWYRYSVQASGGLQSGVSGALGEPIRGDGLFIPAPFDTESRYATLSATAGLLEYLWATARARYSSMSAPDRADQQETELFGALTWGYAGINLSLEDRYLVSSVGGLTIRENRFLFRIHRSFGSYR